ncbi:hypothetical protein SAMN04488061_0173 [Filomicrobium insigne]|uniref:Uncharacterized protein n=1 Tax=Filomicrobium insigne TaxID=418854 RepID=A0A1H0GIQ6_9HYPH|nr:hypothetical protein SAMN04488061_0173 [Filomicrobium insigne]
MTHRCIVCSLNRALLALSRDDGLRHSYLLRRWQSPDIASCRYQTSRGTVLRQMKIAVERSAIHVNEP